MDSLGLGACCKSNRERRKGKVTVVKKAHCLVSALIAVLIISLPGHTATLNWAKYVSQDGSFSFHHPQGWQVTESESGLVVQGGSSSEQLWLVPLPYQDSWSAQQHANFFLSILQKENPELEASGWQSDPGGEAVLFDLIYRSEQQQLQGIGLVTKDSGSEQALWFHHLAPEEGYVRARGESILEGFVNSLAPGSTSEPPTKALAVSSDYDDRTQRIAQNADAFLFVLEFSLGSPLTLSEENMILDELKSSWSQYSDAELAAYDDYPTLVDVIMYLNDEKELTELQRALAESVFEWIDGSDPHDPIVKMIRIHMLEADRRLVDGQPPLTEVVACAYGELLAYAELLGQDGSATPNMIKQDTAEEIKGQLASAWLQLSQEEREQTQTLPAVWSTLRRALSHGGESHRESARNIIAKLTLETRHQSSQDTESPAMALARHQSMLQIQQQTFNHYMWCMGYHRTIYGF